MKAPSSGSTMFVLCGTVQVYNSCTDVHWQYYHAVVVSISSSGQCLVVALISVCVNILQSYETRISECGGEYEKIGRAELFNVLKAYAVHNPSDGYCQAQVIISS